MRSKDPKTSLLGISVIFFNATHKVQNSEGTHLSCAQHVGLYKTSADLLRNERFSILGGFGRFWWEGTFPNSWATSQRNALECGWAEPGPLQRAGELMRCYRESLITRSESKAVQADTEQGKPASLIRS